MKFTAILALVASTSAIRMGHKSRMNIMDELAQSEAELSAMSGDNANSTYNPIAYLNSLQDNLSNKQKDYAATITAALKAQKADAIQKELDTRAAEIAKLTKEMEEIKASADKADAKVSTAAITTAKTA